MPSQPEGYYTEYVHPTPGVIGQGPQRVIQGQGGGLYYTPNHFGTFIPLN
ncbi:ribonuclease domain-containing protein [Labrenzia sp. R5_0]